MSEASRKRCTVAWASSAARQHLWHVEVARDATIAEVLAAARLIAGDAERVPWDTADVGIFGEPCARSAVPRDGDRVEIYRPLRCDPKAARRERVRRTQATSGSGR
jgi:putative ubiquitin-RnfH superfamily antitoxin RatB of RatAB toxin-antitoxin module